MALRRLKLHLKLLTTRWPGSVLNLDPSRVWSGVVCLPFMGRSASGRSGNNQVGFKRMLLFTYKCLPSSSRKHLIFILPPAVFSCELCVFSTCFPCSSLVTHIRCLFSPPSLSLHCIHRSALVIIYFVLVHHCHHEICIDCRSLGLCALFAAGCRHELGRCTQLLEPFQYQQQLLRRSTERFRLVRAAHWWVFELWRLWVQRLLLSELLPAQF